MNEVRGGIGENRKPRHMKCHRAIAEEVAEMGYAVVKFRKSW